MIDLTRNRAELLAEIGAAEPVTVTGPSEAHLFSQVKLLLLERFATEPRPVVLRDLLIPLRNAIGNAYKHGGGGVEAELALTGKGALVAVTDNGPGFDVSRTFARFQADFPGFTLPG